MGAVAAQVLNARGIKVPDDISIVSFTNGILSRYTIPPISGVKVFIDSKFSDISSLLFFAFWINRHSVS